MIPNLKAEDTVKIKSISLESKSINAYEKSVPTYNGLDLNFDVMNFSKLGSYDSVFPYSTFTMPEHDVYFYPNFLM